MKLFYFMLWADEIYHVGPMKQNHRVTDLLFSKHNFNFSVFTANKIFYIKFAQENKSMHMYSSQLMLMAPGLGALAPGHQ